MSGSAVLADGHGHANGQGGNGQGDEGGNGGGDDNGGAFKHVLLLSIDGMHAVDYLNCVKAGTCPNLASLGKTGVNYLATSASKPSDSFPGLTAIISGGSPRTEGAFYDSAYDRSLDPPAETTGNGLVGAPGLCTNGAAPTGTATEYEEAIDLSQSHLNGIRAASAAGPGGLGDDYTMSVQNIQCYDAIKVQAILNEIDGKTHNASGPAPMPNILGMNFQAVSVGQKLVYQDGAVAPGFSETGGYKDAMGTPTDSLAQEIAFVDNSIRLMWTELSKKHRLDSTLITLNTHHEPSPL